MDENVKGVLAASVLLAIGALLVVHDRKAEAVTNSEPYDFVCFDQFEKSVRHTDVVLSTLSHGGTWILVRADAAELYYMQQHGETCFKETSAGVKP